LATVSPTYSGRVTAGFRIKSGERLKKTACKPIAWDRAPRAPLDGVDTDAAIEEKMSTAEASMSVEIKEYSFSNADF
jgi:hypothetical protein